MNGAAANDDADPGERLLQWVDADDLSRLPLRPCNYLPDRLARERAFLADRVDGETYHDLMDRGFRRSGQMFYAMDCPDCRRCVPLRVPVATFRPTKSQRRAVRRNRDVHVTVRTPSPTPATFDLYRRYLRSQHPDAERDESPEQFRASLYGDVVDTVEVLYTLGERLLAVSLLDVCRRSVSAVYHFYDPDHRDRSLGVFSVLAEIDWTRRIGVPFYYLGYWIEGAKTMHYKANYGPHELLRDGRWQPAPDAPQR
jgi:arginine-tRNA-protein transferase